MSEKVMTIRGLDNLRESLDRRQRYADDILSNQRVRELEYKRHLRELLATSERARIADHVSTDEQNAVRRELQEANQEIARLNARLNALLASTSWPHAIPAARVVRIADAVETAMGWAPMWLARDVAREWGGWWMYEDIDTPVFKEGRWYTYGGGRVADVCGFPDTIAPAHSLVSVTAAREWLACNKEAV